jgi:hypothetical protein
MPNDPTAKRWLEKLSELIQEEDPFALPGIEPLPFTISDKGRQQVEQVLQEGEELLWAGHPDERRFASKYSVAVWVGILFIIPAVMSAMGWIGRAADRQSATMMALLGVGIVAAVLVLYSNKTDIVYAVTNKRIVLLSRGNPTSYGKRNITQFRLVPWEGDIGDILFAEAEKRVYMGKNRQKWVVTDIGMYGVKRYQDVRTLIYRVFQFGEDDFIHNKNLHEDLRVSRI